MSTINERIAWCIEDSGLTKTAFAERIKVSQQHVSRLSKNGTPSDRTISDICREFKISEVWLRTGEGKPHIQIDDDDEFIKVCEQINLSDDDLIKRIIKSYWNTDERGKAALRALIDSFTAK